MQALLRSEEPLDRFGALIDLRDLIEGGDSRIAGAATEALRKLTTDDSRRVAAAAQRLLTEEGARAATIAAGGVVPATPVVVTSPPSASEGQETALEPPLPVEPTPSATTEPAPTDSPSAVVGPARIAESSPTASVPWRLGRAASRAAVGSIAGIVFASIWYAVQRSIDGYPMHGDDFLRVVRLGAWITFITVAIVTVAESNVPSLRLPGGDVYRIVGGNRFAAAAVLGVVVALTVALFNTGSPTR